ncbi:SGNH/GDSL hydrolase family protein [Phaeobacter marinintestinus]|uniref:SGNH/GDSL hydrolase family protein n=1 Tax=Falsiphaeobacter marinintestinus TaxID=1492905 RepID=UPI0016454A98|nr:SGNH/GDSL hydrolase family protein [Phaeobacter marinintestinus]
MTNTPHFESLVFFGDSWSDAGIAQSFFYQSFGVPMYSPELTPYGRFTTGLNYADFLGQHLGVAPEDAMNFAIGGARLLTDRTWNEMVGGFLPPEDPNAEVRVDVGAQIERFLATLTPESDLTETAVSLLIGGNDILQIDFATGTEAEIIAASVAYGVEMADAMMAQIQTLADAGVVTLMLYTSPGPATLPFSLVQTPERLLAGQVTGETLNAELAARVGEIEAMGIDVTVIEVGALMNEVAGDFASFGFQTYLNPLTLDNYTVNPALVGIPFDQVAMLDGVHRTEAYDRIASQFQFESLTSDVAIGMDERDVITGGIDADMVLASGGSDTVMLEGGDDVALGGLGNDRIEGALGNDLIAGGSGDDSIYGGAGRDVLVDNGGNDRMFGDAGRDVLIDGAGNDTAFGGGGADAFVYTDQALLGGNSAADTNRFVGGEGTDTLFLRLTEDGAAAFENGDLTLADLGITTQGIENVVAVSGLDIPGLLSGNDLVVEADNWGFI